MVATQIPMFPGSGKTYPTPTLRHLPVRERPASRVADYGAHACSLAELLAAIVGGSHQIEIAYALLERFGDVTGITRASVEELAQVDRLGAARAAALKAALEIGRRLQIEAAGDKVQVRSPADAAALLMPEIGHLEQEVFVVLLLDTRNRVIGQETLYKGSLNASHIRVGEVFREAIRRNCAAILVAHNHPSQEVSPSPEDAALTKQLVEAGKSLDVEVIDHLVISRSRFVSLRERGLGGFR
jgi:DNA repair protein RadC